MLEKDVKTMTLPQCKTVTGFASVILFRHSIFLIVAKYKTSYIILLSQMLYVCLHEGAACIRTIGKTGNYFSEAGQV